MAPIPKSVYIELADEFDTLKKISHRPPVVSNDSGDKPATHTVLHEQFLKLISILDKHLEEVSREDDEEDWLKLLAMKTCLVYEQAKIHISFERFQEAKTDLEKALKLIKGLEKHSFICYLHMRIANHMGFVLSRLGDHLSAMGQLKEISQKDVPEDIIIYSTEELFAIEKTSKNDRKIQIQNIFTNNLQMLSWVYNKLGMENESMMIQYTILVKELDFVDCDAVDWARRCIRVGSLYLVREQFVPARYYLSAAASALDRAEAALVEHADLGKAQAELARGWIYYGLKLFDVSRSKDITKLCERIFDDNAVCDSGQGNGKKEEEHLNDELKFPNSIVNVANVPSKLIHTVGDARCLFQHTHMWLKRARVYYTLRDYPFIYINCVLDLSEIYRFLAFYEPDLETQYCVQKRRSDALETLSNILKEVRPQCYIAVSVELLRELAEVQIEMMAINLKKMYKVQSGTENRETTKRRMEGLLDIQCKLDKVSHVVTPRKMNCDFESIPENIIKVPNTHAEKGQVN